MHARRAYPKILYNGRDISAHILDFSYTDNTDRTDDVSITLSDREENWIKDWFPATGDCLECEIQVSNWESRGDHRTLALGRFEVDTFSHNGTVSIGAVAIPISGSARSEKKYRTWEKVSLKNIAGDISKNTGLSLLYDTEMNPFYDSAEQFDQSDLLFLEERCKSDGLCMKVTDSRLIVFEESKYDEQAASFTVKRNVTDLIGYPRLTCNAKNIYTACEISFFDSKKDKTYIGYFAAPGTVRVGHTLRLRESYNSEKDDLDLNRKAKARLREQNKNEWTAVLTLKGDFSYMAGLNFNLEGWAAFDGKYHITSSTHSLSGSGYTVDIEARKCLEGY